MSNLRLPPEEYDALCQHVLERDRWRCRNPQCNSRNNLHVHHITFRSQQGPDEDWNLCTLCMFCHTGIHDEVDEHGQPGLTIQTPANANEQLIFVWAPGWRPGP